MSLALNTRINYEWLFSEFENEMLVSLSDGICRTEEIHMNTQLLLISLIQHFKVNISLKSR